MHKGAFARRGLVMMRPFMVVVALLAVVACMPVMAPGVKRRQRPCNFRRRANP